MQDELYDAADEFFALMTRLRRMGVGASPPEMTQISPALMALVEQVATVPDSSIVDLARRLERAVPTVSVEVRHLEDAGLVARRPHPQDGRAVQVFLTSEGRALYERVQRARRDTLARLLSGLTSEERTTLLRLLGKAIRALEREAEFQEEGSTKT
ncbi:MarR family transcriptional regulator [Oceanithermus sp.]|uniref:MarR family winged helix-turn-helix transcriptional regulator n=1 Tax=Oceanithermus sp. TaxID=2268145 RepID=UPI0025F71D1E|nr:MarR family transcriptional regulator [Oceanithermus sp.]